MTAERDALRKIAQALVTEDWLAYEGDAGDDIRCPGCGGEEADWRQEPKDLAPSAAYAWRWQHYQHTAECPITKARALLSTIEEK
jgi:aminoglycoside phosphotransferase